LCGAQTSVQRTRTDLALDALDQAVYDRETDAGLVHHSDRGVQTCRFAIPNDWRRQASKPPSAVGAMHYDNALAEPVIGLFRLSGFAAATLWIS